jgi:vesicle-fusing ATPase
MEMAGILFSLLTFIFGWVSFLFINHPKAFLIGLLCTLIASYIFYRFVIKPHLSSLFKNTPEDLTYTDGRDNKMCFAANEKEKEEESIGGMTSQLNEIYQQITVPRMIDPVLQRKLKLRHVKGIIFHGPPGTGKTLLARNLAKRIGCQEPAKIAASSLIDKYYGESEKKLRELFVHPPGKLHMVILDEIESICPVRSSGTSDSKFYTALTNQLLSLMDGLDSDPNVIVVGTTNNMKLIDPAILRPGRFDLHMDVPLPNREAREEIFKVYTDHLINENYMEEYDMERVLDLSDGNTGADISEAVRRATSTALNRHIKNNEPLLILESDILTGLTRNCTQN